MSTRYCAFCEDPVGEDHVEIDEDPILEDRDEGVESWVAHASCWRRHQAALENSLRMFENLDRDPDTDRDIVDPPTHDVDEDELDAEIEEIEEKLDELLDEGQYDEE